MCTFRFTYVYVSSSDNPLLIPPDPPPAHEFSNSTTPALHASLATNMHIVIEVRDQFIIVGHLIGLPSTGTHAITRKKGVATVGAPIGWPCHAI